MDEYYIFDKLVRLVKVTTRKVVWKVEIQDEQSQEFETHVGLRQGDALACPLFNITLEKAVKNVRIDNRGNIFNKLSQILAYADDVDLVAGTTRKLEEINCSANINHSDTAVPTAILSNRNESTTVTSTETTTITPSTTCTSTSISNYSTSLTKILSTTNLTSLDTSTTDNTMPVISKPNIPTSPTQSTHTIITKHPSSSSLNNISCSVNENKENPAPQVFSVSNEENTSKSSSKRTVSEAISPPIETSASDDVFSKPTQKQKRIKTKTSTIPLETLMQPIRDLFNSEKQMLTFEETVDLLENTHGTKDVLSVINKYTLTKGNYEDEEPDTDTSTELSQELNIQ
ncbi:PH domain-containing rcdII-like [Diabrotica virgifera virgifera]|uniref:Reverse transcriptase domain-containing protein n=1 Tax=Diabrotica virgifera virgifera TaxID=50390 RepID=A0ABM5K5C5_DIAVI|nr:PH domain-containing rcdII-like [Diabrotica virgifera virgifera]